MDDTPMGRPGALDAILADAAAADFRMSCEERTGALLATLAATKPGGRLLELGTGVGAGTAWLLDGAAPDAEVTTVEVDPDTQAIAAKHLGADPRVRFVCADADEWLTGYAGEPFDLAFVDCVPGKFERLPDVLALLRPGGIYVGDDLLPHDGWPAQHRRRVDTFLAGLPLVLGWRATTMAWGSGLVVAAKA